MKPKDRRRLAALEERLAEVDRALRATRAQVSVLRGLLADDGPVVDTVSGAGEPTVDRPALQVLEGAPAVDAASVRATAAADQSPGWAAHSDRVAGRARRMPRRDRHGLHSL